METIAYLNVDYIALGISSCSNPWYHCINYDKNICLENCTINSLRIVPRYDGIVILRNCIINRCNVDTLKYLSLRNCKIDDIIINHNINNFIINKCFIGHIYTVTIRVAINIMLITNSKIESINLESVKINKIEIKNSKIHSSIILRKKHKSIDKRLFYKQ